MRCLERSVPVPRHEGKAPANRGLKSWRRRRVLCHCESSPPVTRASVHVSVASGVRGLVMCPPGGRRLGLGSWPATRGSASRRKLLVPTRARTQPAACWCGAPAVTPAPAARLQQQASNDTNHTAISYREKPRARGVDVKRAGRDLPEAASCDPSLRCADARR